MLYEYLHYLVQAPSTVPSLLSAAEKKEKSRDVHMKDQGLSQTGDNFKTIPVSIPCNFFTGIFIAYAIKNRKKAIKSVELFSSDYLVGTYFEV